MSVYLNAYPLPKNSSSNSSHNLMDFEFKLDAPDSQSETMDLLSRAWCNFAVHEALQTELQDRSLVLRDNSMKLFDNVPKSPSLKMDTNVRMEYTERSIPSWRSNDVKSWIWMQQAMHPELNYNSCFRKKWMQMSWKINVPLKKWVKEIKQRRKECKRLQRAEVHAAVSVAGVAAALAAIATAAAAQNTLGRDTSKEAAMATAAALVAAQCAKTAEAMGAKKDQLKTVIASAISGTSTTDILTLTAAASTSLKGAATLKERTICKSRLKGSAPVLPIEENNDSNFDYQQGLSILAKGASLDIETSDGKCMLRSVCITLNKEAKVVLRTKRPNLLNAFASKKESVVIDQHAEMYKNSEGEETDTCFLIVLSTDKGIIKLDMMDDYHRYRLWAMTIDHMLALSTSLTKYDLQDYKS